MTRAHFLRQLNATALYKNEAYHYSLKSIMAELSAFTLTSITVMGSNVGNQFTIKITAAGDVTTLHRTLPYNVTVPFSELLAVKSNISTPYPLPVLVEIEATSGTFVAGGNKSQVLTINPDITQPFTIDVTVSTIQQPPLTANVRLRFEAAPRLIPIIYWPDWLCYWPYIPYAYVGWLCDARALPNFPMMTEVVELDNLMIQNQPVFDEVNNALGLSYSPGIDFPGRVDASFDSVSASVYRADNLSWRTKLKVGDFFTEMDGRVRTIVDKYIDFIPLPPVIDPLCSQWYSLLNCFCSICANRLILHNSVVSYYDVNVAPKIDALHVAMNDIAIAESIYIPIPYYPYDDQCRKLRFILSVFEWRCRRRRCIYTGLPISDQTIATHYSPLSTHQNILNGMLEAFGVYLCTPAFRKFCNDWRTLADCLKRICANRDSLPVSVANDVEATFGPIIRTLYPLTRAVQQLPTPGLGKTCTYLDEIDKFMAYVCMWGHIPTYSRFTTYQTLLGQLQTAMTGFKSRNGDLCADRVDIPEQFCEEWLNTLDCIGEVCFHKYEAPAGLITGFKNSLTNAINTVFNRLYPNGPVDVTNPGPRGVDVLCWKLTAIKSRLVGLCNAGEVDPFEKMRLQNDLDTLKQALNTLKGLYPDLCEDSVGPEHCDTWRMILNCLQRFCNLRHVLHEGIVQAVFQAFAPLVDYLHWMTSGVTTYPDDYYQPKEVYSLSEMCDQVDDLVDYFQEICSAMQVHPIISLRLEELLPDWSNAYDEVLQIPGLCTTVPPEGGGCDEYMEMLECLKSLCDRRNEVSQNLRDQFLANFSAAIDGLYVQVYGTRPNFSLGTIDLLCAEIAGLYDVVAVSCCGAPSDGEPDETEGGVMPSPNQPQPNEGGCTAIKHALGGLLPAFRSLQQQLMSLAFSGGPNICNCFATDCDVYSTIPKLFELLCCRPQAGNFLVLAPIVSITNWYQQVTPLLQQIILRSGLDPATTVPATNDFCGKLRHALTVLLYGISSPATLTPLLRYELRVRYKHLRSFAMQYAKLVQDNPQACGGCNICTKWLDMLSCLCKVCGGCKSDPVLAGLLTEGSVMCQRIDALFDHIITMPNLAFPVEINPGTAVCCEKLRWLARFFSMICMECNHSTYISYGLEFFHANFAAAYQTLRQQMTAASLTLCDSACGTWVPMLECLVTVQLRQKEIAPNLITQINGILSGLITPLYNLVTQQGYLLTPLGASNPVPEVFSANQWKLLELLRAFYWLCSPYSLWSSALKSGSDVQLVQWRTAYAQITRLLADNGYSWICTQQEDQCSLLDQLPEYYAILCESTPAISTAQGAGARINQLLSGYQSELARIAGQLGTPLPSASGTFCDSLRRTFMMLAVAISRIDELSKPRQLMVRYFYWTLRGQVLEYSASLGNGMPHEPTPIGEFRAAWMEILGCFCATCNEIDTISAEPQSAKRDAIINAYAAVDAYINSQFYPVILSLAPIAGLPVVASPCATSSCDGDLCRKLRIVISFFSSYCLGCRELGDQPNGNLVTVLATHLEALRGLVVNLRSALVAAGKTLCPQERPTFVSLQSDYLYLQAAGSTGSDGSSEGIHLRYALLKNLGSQHLPKGNLAAPSGPYPASYGFNKPNDFVKIYRTPYDPNELFEVHLDLTQHRPKSVHTGGNGVTWMFEPDAAEPENYLSTDPKFLADSKTSVAIRFREKTKYDTACGGCNPTNKSTNDAAQLVQAYNGIIEIETMTRPFYMLEVRVTQSGGGAAVVRMESISPAEVTEKISAGWPVPRDLAFKVRRQLITGRQTFNGTGWHAFTGESISFVRLRCDNCRIAEIRVHTYHDYYWGIQRRYKWQRITDLSLSVDRDEVYKRLQYPGRYTVDNRWPKYDITPQTGTVGKVNICNYRDRWDRNPNPEPGLGCTPHGGIVQDTLSWAVTSYLDLSRTPGNSNPVVSPPSKHPDDKAAVNLKLLDILQLAAQDFHIARMLGLGYIDWEVPQLPGGTAKKYMYFAEYETRAPLGTIATSSTTVHRYLTLPTSQQDSRLPVAATLSGYDIGLPPSQDGTVSFTDNNGYTRFGDSRFIRLNKAPLTFDLVAPAFDPLTFFGNGATFNRASNTRPILFGIAYARKNTGTGVFERVRPDISNDKGAYDEDGYIPYADRSGLPEPVAIPDPVRSGTDPHNPLFVHQITRPQRLPGQTGLTSAEGTHKYGIYSINWFSRVSAVNFLEQEIYTEFPKRNTLLPPLNLMAQFIQPEEPPLFTSVFEQDDANNHLMNTTRLTFDWNHTHNDAYQNGTHIRFFFRHSPKAVRGRVKEVKSSTNGQQLVIQVEGYPDYAASQPGVTINPVIEPGASGRFIGSIFATVTGKFAITNIQLSGTLVVSFTVSRVAETTTAGTDMIVDPKKGDYFIVVENLNIDGIWTPLDDCDIELDTFNSMYYETSVGENGKEIIHYYGGLQGPATVTKEGVDEDGVYRVEFQPAILSPYSKPLAANVKRVEWYGGTARMPNGSGGTNVVKILRFDTSSVDPSQPANPGKTVFWVLNTETRNGQPGSLKTGINTDVNFHPGYRAYLALPDTPDVDLVEDILPRPGELARKTFLAAQAYDTTYVIPGTGSEHNTSPLTPPAVHIARKIIRPLAPILNGFPDNAKFATRPDVYGRATYTFDTIFRTVDPDDPGAEIREIFGMIFYRGSHVDVLRALYKPDTATRILEDLPLGNKDPDFVARWLGLANVVLDSAGEFAEYGGYKFPVPDNRQFETPNLDDPLRPLFKPFTVWGALSLERKLKYARMAVNTAFLPLTERPVMYAPIEVDQRLRTSSAPPVVRDEHGEPLEPDDERYNPTPMIRRRPAGPDPDDGTLLRFTDYTLDGASADYYFYYAVEVDNTWRSGERSFVLGPVHLVNTFPPDAPQIMSVRAVDEVPQEDQELGVEIAVRPYTSSDNIVGLRLYRTYDAAKAVTIRMMDEVSEQLDSPVAAFDNFSLGGPVRYGQPIYYRVVALRRIINERGEEELVPSPASELVVANVIDSTSPEAPVITATPDEPQTAAQFQPLDLEWPQTTFGGTYSLYMHSGDGNWVRVAGPFTPATPGEVMSKHYDVLPKLDAKNAEIIYHFKVMVENTSGLQNLEDNELIL